MLVSPQNLWEALEESESLVGGAKILGLLL